MDLETTGLTIGKIGITEIGMILWDTSTRSLLKAESFIVDPGKLTWEQGALETNSLTPEICSQYGKPEFEAIIEFLKWMDEADYIVAHNGLKFDRQVIRQKVQQYELKYDNKKLWIDTKCDLDIPFGNSTRLTYLAADHGFLNPFPHRALFDTMTMLRVLDSYDINKVVEVARSPTLVVKALVTYDSRDLAKKRGYHWNPENKTWTMVVKECFLTKEREGAKAEKLIISTEKGKEEVIQGFEIEVVEVICQD